MPKRTGPKTAEGKAKSSLNALKHGLTSDRMFVLCNENEHKWAWILKAWTDKLQPRDDAEFMVVEDIAHAHWRLRRARTWEGSIIDVEMEEQADVMAATYDPVDEGTRQACAFKALAEKSPCLDQLHRYETRARRAFKNGIVALEQLRAMTATRPANNDPAPAPAHERVAPTTELQPNPEPELQPAPEPEQPKAAADASAPVARPDGDKHRNPAKPGRAAIGLRGLPKHLRRELNYLQKTIPNFDTYWHYDRMSPGLQQWISKRAA